MTAHAKLSASGSFKWLVCTPSAELEKDIPDKDTGFSEEGTKAHNVLEHMLNLYLHGEMPETYWQLNASQEMLDYVSLVFDRAVDLIEDARARCQDPVILVEKKLDFSPWVPEGFGTGDLVIITDDIVEVADLKYGKGVPVSAENNSQARLYGLGAYNELSHLYDIRRVRTHIWQPRLDSWTTEELTVEELLAWAKNEVVPKAQLAWVGEGELVPGEHCTSSFCRARFTCPARAKQGKELVEASFALQPPDMLTPEQLEKVLTKADQVIRWLNDVKEWSLDRAKAGHPPAGFKLVAGRSNRRYESNDAVVDALLAAGVEEDLIYDRSLIGITAMEKLLGKKKFAEILGKHIEKPEGKPTLVPASDPRPAIDKLAYFDDESQED